MLDRVVRIGSLLDFYGSLLTERQRSCAELRYWEDLSLGEIASLLRISRQAVYDTLKRTEVCLEEYEAKLGLLREHLAEKRRLEEIVDMVDAAERELSCSGAPATAASRLRAARLAARELLSGR